MFKSIIELTEYLEIEDDMRVYRIRDNKTGKFISSDSSEGTDKATCWFSVNDLEKWLKTKSSYEESKREVYATYGEKFPKSLLPKTWEIVEYEMKEIAVFNLSEVVK